MIDIHSHILPKMDDGSSSSEESKQLLEILKKQGVETVVATPHFYAEEESPESFFTRREETANRLKEVATVEGIKVLLGAEVLFYSGISQTQMLSHMAIEGTGLLLLEMPFCRWPDSYIKEIIALSRHDGMTVVLAHIDRYFPFENPHVWDELFREGILFQANATSLLERKTQRVVLSMLRQGKIHFIASDCHNMTSRFPKLEEAYQIIRKHLGDGVMNWLEGVSRTFFD